MNYKMRIERVQKALQGMSCNALLVDDPVNLYYLTGINLSAGKMVVHENGAHLFVDGRYLQIAEKLSPVPVTLTSQEQNHFQDYLRDLPSIQILAFNSETTSYSTYNELKKNLDPIALLAVDNPIKKMRAIKDDEEITLLRQAALLGNQGFDYICSLIKENISESELATELEIFWKRKGAKGVAFDPIVAFGPNSAMPHYRAGQSRLKKGEHILIDIGVNLDHYHSDMTRVVYFHEPDPKINEIYEIVKKAQLTAISLCRPGVLVSDLDHAARQVIADHGYGEFFNHSLGHGVGLEIHEWPPIRASSKDIILKKGMVLTIEPGIYLPGIGGVRLEDTLLITYDSYESLTKKSLDPINLKK